MIINLISTFLNFNKLLTFDNVLQQQLIKKHLVDENISIYTCDEISPIFAMMAIVSIVQMIISVVYIGRKVIHHSISRNDFKKKFIVVAFLLLIIDVVMLIILVPAIFTKSD